MKLFSEYRGLSKENYVLFISRMMTALGQMIYPMLTLILSQKMNMSAGTIALFMMAYSILCIPAGLLGGKLADAFSKKKILIFCSGAAGCCSLVCALMPLSILSICIYAAGVVVSQIQTPAYSALIADVTASKDRSRAYSLSYLGMNTGMMLSPAIAGFLFNDYLWLMFLLNACALLGSTCMIYFFLSSAKTTVQSNSSYENVKTDVSALSVMKQNKIILIFFLIMAIDSAVYNQYSYLIPLDLGTVHGNSSAMIYGVLSSLNCIVVVIFTPMITRMFSHTVEPKKFLISDILMVGSYALFRLCLGIVPTYYLVMLIYTWGEIFRTITSDPYLTRRIPQSHRGRLMAFNNVGMVTAYAVSEIVVGTCYDHLGSVAAWLFVIALGSVSIIMETWLIKADRIAYPEIYKK